MNWQPIESAPKDGKLFLFTNGTIIGTGHLVNGQYFAADSWQGERNTVPTHWMPFPPLPSKVQP